MSRSTAIAPASERLHALDAVRGFALLLGIVLHATLSFVPAPTRIWIIQDTHQSLALGLLFFVIHVFRMTTFFLMAGFFARMSFHRRGIWGFVTDRLQRIGLPLVVGWPIVFTPMALVVIWAAGFPNGGPIPGAPRWPPVLPNFPLIKMILWSQVINGMLLPFVLIYMILIVNKSGLMKEWTNSRSYNLVAWTAVAVMIGLTLALVGISVRDLLR